jgi:hypothetical protein
MNQIFIIRITLFWIDTIFILATFCRTGQDLIEEVFNNFVYRRLKQCRYCRREKFLMLWVLVHGTVGMRKIKVHF